MLLRIQRRILREINKRCTYFNVFTPVHKDVIALLFACTQKVFAVNLVLMKDARLIALGTVFLCIHRTDIVQWESLYPCQNALRYTTYATVFTLQNPLPLHWKCQKYCYLVFIIRENKTWTLLLASVGTEFEASAHLKMFIFVLNGSFVICELCCSVCKSAKSICTWCESAFLLNSMSLQQKK